jgi:hypothetical protein
MDECARSRRLLNDHLVNAVSDEAPRTGGIDNVSTRGDECTGGKGSSAGAHEQLAPNRSDKGDGHTTQSRERSSQSRTT